MTLRYDDKSEMELIELARQGVAEAEETLFNRYKAFICKRARFYYISDGSGDVEDLIQIATLGFFKAVRHYDPEKNSSFPSYAHTVITNTLNSAMRMYEQKTDATLLSIDDESNGDALRNDLVISDNPVSSHIHDEGFDTIMAKAKEALSPKQYAVFELWAEGLSYQAIAIRLKMPPKAVDNARTAAKAKLKKILKSEDD